MSTYLIGYILGAALASLSVRPQAPSETIHKMLETIHKSPKTMYKIDHDISQ